MGTGDWGLGKIGGKSPLSLQLYELPLPPSAGTPRNAPSCDSLVPCPHDWALTAFDEGAVFTAFDIETTGLDNRRDRIVELGAVKFNKQGEIDRYCSLIDPGFPMPEEAGKVNNITDAMLAGQPSIQEALPAFLRFAADTIVLAHNAPFDCGFVNNSLSCLCDDGYVPFSALPNRVVDTLPLARRILPGRKHYNLQDITASLGIIAEAAHRALDDARLCMVLFIYLANYVKENR